MLLGCFLFVVVFPSAYLSVCVCVFSVSVLFSLGAARTFPSKRTDQTNNNTYRNNKRTPGWVRRRCESGGRGGSSGSPCCCCCWVCWCACDRPRRNCSAHCGHNENENEKGTKQTTKGHTETDDTRHTDRKRERVQLPCSVPSLLPFVSTRVLPAPYLYL